MVLNSFTRTWLRFFSGELTEAELLDAQFNFNCCRGHLFPNPEIVSAIGNSYPSEITWVRDVKSVHVARVPARLIPDLVKVKFEKFLDLVLFAECHGSITYRQDDAPESRIQKTVADYREHWGE